ncbi:MAG: Ig-like domain-containing protein [Chloroflexota bacterium]|nr:Ig-like domain-containing protein [Chloroflexota bacterium]
MTKRAMPLRTLAVLGIGLAALAAILYYASTVDARPPTVRQIALTQHLTRDPRVALTTSSIEVDFSEPVVHAGAEAAFRISPTVSGSFSWSAASLTFTPATRLSLRTQFVVSIGLTVRDQAGNAMTARPAPFTFTTVGNPDVVASQPVDAAVDVTLDAQIVIDFSTLMDTASVERALHLVPAVDVRLRWSRERLTIVPVAPLGANQRYAVAVDVGAHDQAGTPLEHAFRLSFRTVASGLAARMLVPSDAVEGVAISTAIAVVFDRALDPASVHDDLLTIKPAVAGSLNAIAFPGAAGLLDSARRVLSFQPSGPLDPNTTYEVTLKSGLLGVDGAGLPAGLAWSFTTGSPTATLSNQVVFLSDRAGIANLWAMNPDGTNQHQLSAELSPVLDYAVAPDGRAFVVADGAVLVWQRADGSARRLLTDRNVLEYDPSYSPDGTTLVFARADPALGSGLGLWMRDADGSDPRMVELPTLRTATPSPAVPVRVPLLRAPRISPDGTAVAFVDEAGRVAILDLELKQLSSAPFVAFSAPTWLADGSAVLVSGAVPDPRTEPRVLLPHSAPPLLDAASLHADPAQLASLRMAVFGRFASSVTTTPFGAGASSPVVDADGRLAYIRLDPADAVSGSLWLASSTSDAGRQAMRDPGARASFAAFAPEAGAMVISRVAAAAEDPTLAGGVWLLDLSSGNVHQLSRDGTQPRWLP